MAYYIDGDGSNSLSKHKDVIEDLLKSSPECSEPKDITNEEEEEDVTRSNALDIPTAVEAQLPWKRSTGREGMSSSIRHSLPDEEHPPIGEMPSWFSNLDYTEGSAQIPAPGMPRSRSVGHNLTMPTLWTNTSDANSVESDTLPLPWRTNSIKSEPIKNEFTDKDNVDNKEEDNGVELPLPWKRQDTAEDSCPLRDSDDNVDQYSTACSLGESTHDDSDSCFRHPWRLGSRRGPVRSPSATFEMDSLYPQPSNHSHRLSEAESRHSEPYVMHHHVIDLPTRILPDNLEHFSFDGQGLELEDDEGQEDALSRVESWLHANDYESFEPPPEDVIEHDLEHSNDESSYL